MLDAAADGDAAGGEVEEARLGGVGLVLARGGVGEGPVEDGGVEGFGCGRALLERDGKSNGWKGGKVVGRTPRDIVGGDAEPDGRTKLGRLPLGHDEMMIE